MVEKNIVSDVVDDTSPISNIVIENNRVVGFCIIFMGITTLLLG